MKYYYNRNRLSTRKLNQNSLGKIKIYIWISEDTLIKLPCFFHSETSDLREFP